jgi:ubiquinone/menaquinone biosynthesis C-methylase UbiE
MKTLFWTGKLSLPLRLMINMGSVIAWITGNARNTSLMKERMKDGYNGKYSGYVHRYDELATFHYEKISKLLIQDIECRGKEVIDIGCGTGILSLIVLEKSIKKLACVDQSRLMLDKNREKCVSAGYSDDLITFHESDAERLIFDDGTFDVVFSNMVLGMIPNQQATISELSRVLRPGGTIAISAHGPAHYFEAIEAAVRSMNKRYFMAHRMEFWPRNEKDIQTFFINAGLDNIHTKRLSWTDEFDNGGEVFDFFASTSGLWWYHRLPPEIRNKETEKTRNYFQYNNVAKITTDVVFAFGTKKSDPNNRAISADAKSRAAD